MSFLLQNVEQVALEVRGNNMEETLKNIIERALTSFGVPKDMVKIHLDHPEDFQFGDYSTNIALILSKQMGATSKNPVSLAEKIVEKIKEEKNPVIAQIKIAGPGFINFYLAKDFFVREVQEVLDKNLWYGKNSKRWKEKVIIEYTNTNVMKEMHIGHLMSNIVGESLSRIIELNGAEVKRNTYQGDVGLHIAKSLFGMMKLKNEFVAEDAPLNEKSAFIGKAYALGSQLYEDDAAAKAEIDQLNKTIFDKSNEAINELYAWGRKVSLEHFEELYKKLGTKFDYYFFESEVAHEGIEIVREYLKKGIFEESDGAIVFKGEKYDPKLHTRVFINSLGVPTYEAKDIGHSKRKYDTYPFTQAIIVTGKEQIDYFKVVFKTLEQIFPDIACKMKHMHHGLLQLSTGKMSSRKGNIITGESLISDVEDLVLEKIQDRNFDEKTQKDVANKVAIAAIKYSILKQGIGKDIIFDFEKSLSFEGDSGPYLQYAYVRAKSILAKAEKEGIKPSTKNVAQSDQEISDVERLVYRFPEIVVRAGSEYSPNTIATYLIELSGAFNSYYAKNKIVDPKDPTSPYKVAITEAVSWIIKDGLHLLGIQVPEKM